jgi:hypothetical protein
MVHGMDMITAKPRISVNRISAGPGDAVYQPNTIQCIAITPVDSQGLYGLFMGRTYLMATQGKEELTPFPEDEIVNAC